MQHPAIVKMGSFQNFPASCMKFSCLLHNKHQVEGKKKLKKEALSLEREITKMLKRIVQTVRTTIQKVLEGEAEKIEAERHRLEQLHDQSPQQEINYEKNLELTKIFAKLLVCMDKWISFIKECCP